MIALITIFAVVLVIAFLLLLPICVDVSFDHDIVLKIKYLGIILFDNKKQKKPKKTKAKTKKQNADKSKQKKDNFILRTYKQKGLLGTISYFSELLSLIFKRLLRLLKHIKFRRFKLNITVATADAANTAIQYGKICAAVYPVVALLEANTDLKTKEINVSADFDKKKSEFKTSISIKTKVIYLLAITIGAFIQYVKIQRKESEKYEREQSKERD